MGLSAPGRMLVEFAVTKRPASALRAFLKWHRFSIGFSAMRWRKASPLRKQKMPRTGPGQRGIYEIRRRRFVPTQ
jgi:hypothetical protein